METTVRTNVGLTADFRLMEVEWPGAFAVPVPGQFVMVLPVGAATAPLWRRPLGVHDYRCRRGGASVSLLFQVVGPVTRRLAATGRGGIIDLLGPLGSGFSPVDGEHWLVSGGRGIAPLFYFARILREAGMDVRVLAGGGTAGHVPRVTDLEAMGCKVKAATEDGSLGRRGLVTELLERDLARVSGKRREGIVLSACGPEGMLRAVAGIAKKKGITARLSLDTLMACGQGLCQGCTIPTREGYKLCCREGPVFESGEVLW